MAYRLLTDLAVACRKSGLPVVEIPDWQRRGRPASSGGFNPRGVVAHHTGGGGEGYGYAAGTLVNGVAGLPGPLCHIGLGRDGTVYVIAAGRANHAGRSRSNGFVAAGDGNSQSLGIEAMNSGFEGWSAVQLDAYHRLCAALCDHYGWPRSHVLAHAETSTAGKWDPGFGGRVIDMTEFRRRVATAGAPTPARKPAPAPPIQEDDMPIPAVLVHKGRKHRYAVSTGAIGHCATMTAWNALVRASGVKPIEMNATDFVSLLGPLGVPAHLVNGVTGHVFDPKAGEFRAGGFWSWAREAGEATRPGRPDINTPGTLASEVAALVKEATR